MQPWDAPKAVPGIALNEVVVCPDDVDGFGEAGSKSPYKIVEACVSARERVSDVGLVGEGWA